MGFSLRFKQISLNSEKTGNFNYISVKTKYNYYHFQYFFCDFAFPKMSGGKECSLLALLLLPVWLCKVTSNLKQKEKKDKDFNKQ